MRNDINDLLQAMDVFLFPSVNEGLGIALIEAQATGLTCIVSKEGIPPEAYISDWIEGVSLKASFSDWADIVLRSKDRLYMDREYNHIKNKEFDIYTVSKWLEEFYLKIV
jgi:glycosyltransferase involved in cell wall biosynthesis